MGMHQCFKRLSGLEKLIRLPGKFKYSEHNVVAHFFKITKIAQCMTTVEEYRGNRIDWESLYEKSLNHGFAEVFTGDIEASIKYTSKKLGHLFSQVEEEMVDTFIKEEVPTQYQRVYREHLRKDEDDSLEGRILSVADKIDLLYETFEEIQERNPGPLFFEIYKISLETIIQLDYLESIKNFIESIMPEMLTENFTPRTELRKMAMSILSRRSG